MKLMSFAAGGKPSWGAAVEGGVVDLGKKLDGKYPTLKSLLAAGALAEAKAAAAGATADAAFGDITFLPVIPDPDKILCIGLNYKAHIEETGRSDSEFPVIFNRYNNTQIGHNQPMVRPKVSDKYDYEGELAVIIGKHARHVAREQALDYVAGYSCYNDGSVRDWQRHTHQFLPGKNFPATGAFGPWMVTSDEIPDPTKMRLRTILNGEVMQDTTTDLMVFDIPHLIAYISTFTPLEPGDVIVTGTPGGVGFRRDPQVFMKPGDKIEIDIDKIGTLVNSIADE